MPEGASRRLPISRQATSRLSTWTPINVAQGMKQDLYHFISAGLRCHENFSNFVIIDIDFGTRNFLLLQTNVWREGFQMLTPKAVLEILFFWLGTQDSQFFFGSQSA